MKRSTALQNLSRDHHVALRLALTLKRAEPDTVAAAARALDAFLAGDGDRHFRLEEELLVPALPPVLARRLVDEHERLRRDAAALADEPDLTAVHRAGELLAAHVRFEEREAFPALEATLTDAELDELGAALAAA
jgi:hypothetical protein